MNPLFLNTVLLGGTTEQKLSAAHEAGFDEVELWTDDVAKLGGGAAAVVNLGRDLGLGFTDYQVLLDFDGAPQEKRAAKRAEAITMLDTAAQLGISTVLVPASTSADCEAARVQDDLAWLVDEAKSRGRRIAYEGMAWSTINGTLAKAWQAIRDLDPRHAGLVLDSFHLFVRGENAGALNGVPIDRIFLAQLSDVDAPVPISQAKHIARHARLLPGQGRLPLATLVAALIERGYRGPIGLEVFNDELHAQSPVTTARQAMQALRTLDITAVAEAP